MAAAWRNRHTSAQEGWEAIADYALDWALANVGRTAADGAVDPGA